LKTALEGWRLRSDLGKLVELRGFEPRTSCMPCKSSQSLDVAGSGSTSGFSRSMPLVMA
jgi:hypothetical protein